MSDTPKTKGRPKKRKTGYLPKERGLCVMVYDLGGKPIPAETVEEILNTVNDVSLKNGLVLTYTQT
jgi:hypothetical protein